MVGHLGVHEATGQKAKSKASIFMDKMECIALNEVQQQMLIRIVGEGCKGRKGYVNDDTSLFRHSGPLGILSHLGVL